MRIGHIAGIVISGCVWLGIGCLLTFKGLFLIALAMIADLGSSYPLVNLCTKLFRESERSILFLVFLAVILGLIKGRFVLANTVKRTVKRLLLIPSPLKIQYLFPWSYVILVIGMMSLGMSLKYLPIPKDVRGFIDIAVGSALINGAFIYFKHATLLKIELARRKK